MSRSRHQRNAVSVLPLPVGARISVFSPRAMAGQPSRWGAVGCSKTARNQEAVSGWKSSRASLGRRPGLLLCRHSRCFKDSGSGGLGCTRGLSGCPTSRSFFARCGIPQLPTRNLSIHLKGLGVKTVVSHISRKTSEMWGTRPLFEGRRPEFGGVTNDLCCAVPSAAIRLRGQCKQVRSDLPRNCCGS